ncbi:13728_t:CDS:2, partial [Ambispora leptoticha]
MLFKKSSMLIALLLLLTITSLSNIPTTNAQCYSHNPLKISDKTPVNCAVVNERSFEKRQTLTQPNSTQMFQITFTCGISNKSLCTKVNNAFTMAGMIITATLKLTSPITVNATFINFCNSMGDCGTNTGFLTLAPARTMPMVDLDGKQRFYPQALVKQFGYSTHHTYGPFDITALFNS